MDASLNTGSCPPIFFGIGRELKITPEFENYMIDKIYKKVSMDGAFGSGEVSGNFDIEINFRNAVILITGTVSETYRYYHSPSYDYPSEWLLTSRHIEIIDFDCFDKCGEKILSDFDRIKFNENQIKNKNL